MTESCRAGTYRARDPNPFLFFPTYVQRHRHRAEGRCASYFVDLGFELAWVFSFLRRLSQFAPHRLDRIADLVHGALELVLADAEFLGPVPDFVVFMHADAAAICGTAL